MGLKQVEFRYFVLDTIYGVYLTDVWDLSFDATIIEDALLFTIKEQAEAVVDFLSMRTYFNQTCWETFKRYKVISAKIITQTVKTIEIIEE